MIMTMLTVTLRTKDNRIRRKSHFKNKVQQSQHLSLKVIWCILLGVSWCRSLTRHHQIRYLISRLLRISSSTFRNWIWIAISRWVMCRIVKKMGRVWTFPNSASTTQSIATPWLLSRQNPNQWSYPIKRKDRVQSTLMVVLRTVGFTSIFTRIWLQIPCARTVFPSRKWRGGWLFRARNRLWARRRRLRMMSMWIEWARYWRSKMYRIRKNWRWRIASSLSEARIFSFIRKDKLLKSNRQD